MSALFSSIKNIAGNYGQGIMTIQAQFEDMKFGFMPPPSSAAQKAANFTSTNIPSTNLTSPSSSTSNSRKNSFNNNTINMSTGATSINTTSDFNQWLHAMKMVARLPGGTPPEFRRKLWLALADRHLHTSGIDWNKEQAKCLSDAWLDDDEELGIQIVKDLHRTGSSLFSGPNGNINQAKLKRVLLGYARWNPEVGYCQGFNMLGALILQVMDKSEIEALKVMIYLIEGVLPKGYFSGSLGGLQADMAVFREILSTRLPKLSRHLQKLQGPVGENSLEPPLINVFTMQWFLTLFCTCLPKSCVLRVWDLVLIEGSDILLRTALAIWGLLTDRILATKSADDFYCKMGTLSGELLNGHLFDSNGLIQRIVDLGPIADLQKMRDKHLFNITPWKDRRGLRIFYSDDDVDLGDESWNFMSGARRASLGLSAAAVAAAASATNRNQISTQPLNDTRDRIALDISLLKKQYAKLRERQRQAHIILTNTAKQTVNPTMNHNSPPINVNQYLMGRNAIVSSKGRRIGPPLGAIPPARVTAPSAVGPKQQQTRFRNTLNDNAGSSSAIKQSDDNFNIQKSPSTASSISSVSSTSDAASTSAAIRENARKRSESSSYSDDNDSEENDDVEYDDFDNAAADSSTSTSLCDEDIGIASSVEASPLKSRLASSASGGPSDESRCASSKEYVDTLRKCSHSSLIEPLEIANSKHFEDSVADAKKKNRKEFEVDLVRHCDSKNNGNEVPISVVERDIVDTICSNRDGVNAMEMQALSPKAGLNDLDLLTLAFRQQITSTSQLSPIADIAKFLSSSSISPLKTPASCLLNSYPLCEIPVNEETQEDLLDCGEATSDNLLTDFFKVSDEGVTNEYFERINQVASINSERPSHLDLHNSSAGNSITQLTQIKHSKSSITLKSKCIESAHKSFDSSLPVAETTTPVQSPLLASNFVLNYIDEGANKDFTEAECSKVSPKTHFLKEKSISFDNAPNICRKLYELQDISGPKSLPISCPEQNNSIENESNLDSNKNTDRILKMIEENSKILDRIMSKNAQSSVNITSDESALQTDGTETLKKYCDSEVKAVLLVETVHAESMEMIPTLDLNLNKTTDEPPSKINVNNGCCTEQTLTTVSNDSEEFPSTNFSEDKTTVEENVFKYGDMSDYISKYLRGFDDDNPTEYISKYSISGNEEINVSIAVACKPTTPIITLSSVDFQKTDSNTQLDDPIAQINSILSRETENSGDIAYLLKQTYIESSKSPSEALPLDSKIENDLETLLKMSAALLRDEFSLISSAEIEQNFFKDELNIAPAENNMADVLSTSLSEFDSTEILTSKRNSSNFEMDAMETEMEDTPGDISATISSIKNTIKSIDSLCQDDDRRSRERADKTLNDIIKVVEKLEEEKDNRCKSHNLEIEEQSEPAVVIPAIVEHTSRNKRQFEETCKRTQIDEKYDASNSRYAGACRMSRDRSRITSPRRRKGDDFGEYESRARRSKSPSVNAFSSTEKPVTANRYSGDFTKKYSLESFKASTSASSTEHSSSSGGSAISKPSSPYKTNEKLEIRHTTVTSTFYDRFLSQKLEQQHKMDRSPSSPVITKAYLNSLKPISNMSHSYPSDGNKCRRSSRSNETSPVQSGISSNQYDTTLEPSANSTTPKFSYLHLPQLPFNSIDRSNSYTRSCDNIPSNLSPTSGPHSFQPKSNQPNVSNYFETDPKLKRHSAAGAFYLSSSLPIKPKKPSELGIKLGLYKPS